MTAIRRLRYLAIAIAYILVITLVGQAIFGLGSQLGSRAALAAPGDTAIAPLPDNRHAPFAEGEIIVKYRADSTRATITSSLDSYGLQTIDELPGLPVFRVATPPGREEEYAALLAADASVEYAEPNYIMHALMTPNDPYYSAYQWGLKKIGMSAAWDATRGVSAVKVAIIDTGIDPTHPDRPSNLTLDRDYVDGDLNPVDANGHGTHVAGITAGATNNGVGIASVAPGVTIVVLRGLDADGRGYTSDLAQAVRRAADIGAKVINMSWGGTYYSQTLKDAVDYAAGRGSLLVAAAGNSYQEGNPTTYPASFSNVMAVASTGKNDEKAFYSQTGNWVAIAAPGGGSLYDSSNMILSTVPPTIPSWYGSYYVYMSGTSMAAPHVSGLAGLLYSMNTQLSSSQVRSFIQNTAVDLGAAGKDPVFGYGRIDATAAVRAALPNLSVSPNSISLTMGPSDPDQRSQNVSIASSGTGPMSWSAAKVNGATWLSFSPASGTTPSTLTITVNKAGLSQGWYEDGVRITAGAANSPQDIRVRLYVGQINRVFLPAMLK